MLFTFKLLNDISVHYNIITIHITIKLHIHLQHKLMFIPNLYAKLLLRMLFSMITNKITFNNKVRLK